MRDLTWDHVPPKSTLIKPETFASTMFGTMPSPNSHMIRYQSGIKYRSICQECNNEILGRNDKDYQKFNQDVIRFLTTPGKSDILVITTKINRVLRAVCGHMIAMATCFNRKVISDKDMRGFILDEKSKLKRMRIYAWFYPYSTIVNVRDVTVRGNRKGTHPEGFISVIEAFPLAFMISHKDETCCGVDNLSQYLTKDIDEEVAVALHLETAFYPGTRMLKHFLWPVDVENGPFGAAFAMGGQELDGSRIGVVNQ